jgi:hypothetical protein
MNKLDLKKIISQLSTSHQVETLKKDIQMAAKSLKSIKLPSEAETKIKQAEAKYNELLKTINLAQDQLDSEVKKTIVTIKKTAAQWEKTLTSYKKKVLSEKAQVSKKKAAVKKTASKKTTKKTVRKTTKKAK